MVENKHDLKFWVTQGVTMKIKDNALSLSINSPDNIIKFSEKKSKANTFFRCTVKHI